MTGEANFKELGSLPWLTWWLAHSNSITWELLTAHSVTESWWTFYMSIGRQPMACKSLQWKRKDRERVEDKTWTWIILQAGYRGISRLNKNQIGKPWTTRHSGSPDQSYASLLPKNAHLCPEVSDLLTLRCQKTGNTDTGARDGTHDWRWHARRHSGRNVFCIQTICFSSVIVTLPGSPATKCKYCHAQATPYQLLWVSAAL